MSQSTLLPLCVDLDGTLIYNDVSMLSVKLLCQQKPHYALLLPLWILKGRSFVKAMISQRVTLDASLLPYNLSLIRWIESQRVSGRALWLCTGTNETFARQIAAHLGIFDGVLASSVDINFIGHNKANKLVEMFGHKSFDYCGNHKVDLKVWAKSRFAIVVNGSDDLVIEAQKVATVFAVFPSKRNY